MALEDRAAALMASADNARGHVSSETIVSDITKPWFGHVHAADMDAKRRAKSKEEGTVRAGALKIGSTGSGCTSALFDVTRSSGRPS